MPASSESVVAKKLAALQLSFKQQLPGKITRIEQQWEECVQDETRDSNVADLHRMLHSLAGSGGSFFAVAVSKIANELVQALNPIFNQSVQTPTFSKAIQHKVNDLLFQLRQAADKWQPLGLPNIQLRESQEQQICHSVYLVEDDELLASELIVYLEQANLRVRHFTQLSEFETACASEIPTAVIIDIVFRNGKIVGADVFARLRRKLESCPPVIAISKYDGIEVRLAAARMGVCRYFCKPLDLKSLNRTLDGLTARLAKRPYRVLLIDDDESLLDLYAIVLSEADMEVEILSDPMQGLKVLAEFRPDVIVMDVYMPECSGTELAQIIRQDDNWAEVPIMFLSAELEFDRQLAAMNLGGDDFLVKPVEPGYLVAAIFARAKRARWANRLNNDLKSALRENEFQLVTMDQHDIVSTTDIAGLITYVNDRFCEISGYNREELLGQNHRMLKSGFHPSLFYEELWGTISQGKIWRGTICNLRKSGEEYWVESTIVPFLDNNGKPYKYVSARTNITALRQSEERLQRSQEFANIGTWDWNITTGNLYWSNRIGPLFGYEKEVPETTYENFLAAVHPSDQKMVVDAVNNCVEHGAKYNIEHRVIWPDGCVHWMLERGDVIRSEKGEPLHMLGVVQDITERKLLQEKLGQQKRLLDMLHHSTTCFVEKGDIRKVMNSMLDTLLILTGSEYGFAGEVLNGDNGMPYLKTHAITNIAWDLETQALYAESEEKGFELRNLDTLFGQVMTFRRSVVSNNPASDPRAGGLPEGHPAMHSFLGVPIFYGSELVGMYGIANRAIGYDKELEEFLRPFDATYGVMIHSKRMMEMEEYNRKALVNAKEEAENANRAKSQFLSSMSHELRTPMNAIMGFGQLLKMETDQPLNESQQESVDEILMAGDHLLELISEVLDLARIEAGRIDLSIESVVLGEIVAESQQLILPLAQKRGIEISLTHNGSNISIERAFQSNSTIRADRTRLKQVLLNLLSNAVKYNRENGKIIIACNDTNNSQTRISISDTGAGFTSEQQIQLFKAFNRLGAEQSNIEGTGIGLVITKNIVELMGGDIGVDSQPGKGSTFWVELPNDTLYTTQKNETTKKKSPNKKTITKHGHEHTVLYVEDNPTNLRLVTQLLGRRPNIHLWSAHEPLLGLELALEHKPDLILLDINLPGMSGFEVLKQLRQREATRDTSVIAISGNATPKDIERGLKAGFNDYVTKPIDVTAILKAVDKALLEKNSTT